MLAAGVSLSTRSTVTVKKTDLDGPPSFSPPTYKVSLGFWSNKVLKQESELNLGGKVRLQYFRIHQVRSDSQELESWIGPVTLAANVASLRSSGPLGQELRKLDVV